MSDVSKRKGDALFRDRRSLARLAAVQAVYRMLMSGQTAREVVPDFRTLEGERAKPDHALLERIAGGVEERRADIEALLAAAKEKTGGAGEPLLYAVLLCGVYELLANRDVDAPVIISEYLNVSHAFFDQGESRLVNGVLDKVKFLVKQE